MLYWDQLLCDSTASMKLTLQTKRLSETYASILSNKHSSIMINNAVTLKKKVYVWILWCSCTLTQVKVKEKKKGISFSETKGGMSGSGGRQLMRNTDSNIATYQKQRIQTIWSIWLVSIQWFDKCLHFHVSPMKPDPSALYASTSTWPACCIIQGFSHVMLLVRYFCNLLPKHPIQPSSALLQLTTAVP